MTSVTSASVHGTCGTVCITFKDASRCTCSVGGIQKHPTPLHPSLAPRKKTHSWGTHDDVRPAQALRLRASSKSGCGAGCLPCGLPETSYARQPSSGLLLGATRELQIISDNWHKPFCLTMSRRLSVPTCSQPVSDVLDDKGMPKLVEKLVQVTVVRARVHVECAIASLLESVDDVVAQPAFKGCLSKALFSRRTLLASLLTASMPDSAVVTAVLAMSLAACSSSRCICT